VYPETAARIWPTTTVLTTANPPPITTLRTEQSLAP